MANLKDIKNRIKSVESTKKITRAMKMVAGAKVRQSEQAVKASRPFSIEIYNIFKALLDSVGNIKCEDLHIENPVDNYPKLLEKRPVKTVGLFLITSNKGLAGAYSANVVNKALKVAKEYQEQGINVKFFVAGQKGISSLQRKIKYYGFTIEKKYYTVVDDPDAFEAKSLVQDLAAYYVNETIDKIEIITTRYRNMVSYSVENWVLLPVEDVADPHEKNTDNVLESLMEFYPNKHYIFQKVVPMYVTNILYQALREARASEMASRMTAMSAATSNAEKIIATLSVEYNKTRQTAITQEITEVISGANSLE